MAWATPSCGTNDEANARRAPAKAWPEREPRWQPRYVNTGTFREALVGDLVSSTVSTPLS
jgi:hypothetical protein